MITMINPVLVTAVICCDFRRFRNLTAGKRQEHLDPWGLGDPTTT